MPPYERRGGVTPAEHRGGIDGCPRDGDTVHTQRWSYDDDGKRADSPTGAQPPRGVVHGADAPPHREQPARMLRSAGWDEGARSGWHDQGDVSPAPGGQPPAAPPATAPDVVSAQAGATRRDSQGGWQHAPPGNHLHGR